MPKQEKVKVNVKERLTHDTIDLSLSELTDVPVRDIVRFKNFLILTFIIPQLFQIKIKKILCINNNSLRNDSSISVGA